MEKKNSLAKVVLTVILASAAIAGGTYAYRQAAAPAGPLAAVESFYGEWINHPGSPLADKIYLDHPVLTDEFEKKIAEVVAGFTHGGYDPVLLAQDIPSSIGFELSREGEAAAVVTVSEDFGGSVRELEVDLVKADGEWLINDVRDPAAGAPSSDSRPLGDLVGDHIREHIAELSPEPAVLGGSFYLTSVRFEDGNRAIVGYEDGHKAFTAEAVYVILPDGSVRIDSFELIGE